MARNGVKTYPLLAMIGFGGRQAAFRDREMRWRKGTELDISV